MEWSAIATIVLGSSLLGAILNNVVGWWLKRSENSRNSKYISLSLAYIFEGFAYTCLSVIEDHDTAVSSSGFAGESLTRVPNFPALPEFDYQVLDLSILDTVLDFPQQVRFANEAISFLYEVADKDDGIKEAYMSSIKLATDALAIADRIRQRYCLTKRSLRFGDYSVRDRLIEHQG